MNFARITPRALPANIEGSPEPKMYANFCGNAFNSDFFGLERCLPKKIKDIGRAARALFPRPHFFFLGERGTMPRPLTRGPLIGVRQIY